ncbi:MAG: di-trans,poly-cis-decaprenylcistransferase [Gammaproteobacteria bacterium]|nr:di-trans,poly-cis-decaprenylcistransferase [Gammaproteobacteria bacterium]
MSLNPPELPPQAVPKHVAVIMDGNGRWAQQRQRPRVSGHRAGVRAVRAAVRACHKAGVGTLTLFAFSQENWQRPALEVRLLMELFARALKREVASLHKNNVRLRFIGDHDLFSASLREQMAQAEAATAGNTHMDLVVAVGYGGQWDVVEAARRLQREGREITAEAIDTAVCTAFAPAPDLMIRTGGEKRISNFMLWQLAYTELYFSDTLWPDFGEDEMSAAIAWFANRNRRFGRVPEAQ